MAHRYLPLSAYIKQKPGALSQSTALLQADTRVKKIYEKYYTNNVREFLQVIEIIREKGIAAVEDAIKALEILSPMDYSADKIRTICESKAGLNAAAPGKDAISIVSGATLPLYDALLKITSERKGILMAKAQTNFEIKEYCKILRLKQIAVNFEEQASLAADFEEYLHDLLFKEVEAAARKAAENRIKKAHFPYRKYIEDLELDCLPEGLKKSLPQLATLDFIREGRNLILSGNPGTGKTHTAIGLGIKACEEGFNVLFTTVPLLITELKECNSKGKLRAFEKKFAKYDLVIADELGYATFDRAGVELLFTNLSLRAAGKSTIITSNLTFARWNEVFGDPAVTSAMVDRLTFRAILVDMTGESYRFRETLRTNGLDLSSIQP